METGNPSQVYQEAMADVDPSAFLKVEKTTGDPIFDLKKCVWIADEQEGFVSATIKEQTGDVATLELSNGSVREAIFCHSHSLSLLLSLCIGIYV